MNLLSIFFSTAYADTAGAAPQQGSPWTTVIMLVVMFAIFYFLLIRPQSKRAKAQRELLASIGKGDEVMTSGGIMGKIVEVEDTVLSLEIAPNVVIKIQKAAIANSLPKGTIK